VKAGWPGRAMIEPAFVYSLTLKTLLNCVQPIKGFVYESVQFSKLMADTIEVVVFPRLGSSPCCSGCGRRGPCYDHLETRVWLMPPLWAFSLALIYTMRRVHCPKCGVLVERVPWAQGKQTLTDSFRLWLARWARCLSWSEVASWFHVTWADVYRSVRWVVDYGLAHRSLEGIVALGVDEVCVQVGPVYWTLVYQIDVGLTRLLCIGKDRTKESLGQCLDQLGSEACRSIRYVCSDMWRPYLELVRKRLPQVLHILDRFHIRKLQNEAIDQIRKAEARALAAAGLKPRLKKLRWALLKNRRHWTAKERWRMSHLRRRGLASLRAYWLVAAFDHFWSYLSPTWASKFLKAWCQKVRRARLEPLAKVARSLEQHQELLLNWFRAQKLYSGGVIEGLNNKVKLTFRKSYGFRTDEAREIALYHVLGKLPEPDVTHRFF
jgi:transposase